MPLTPSNTLLLLIGIVAGYMLLASLLLWLVSLISGPPRY